MSNFNNYEFLNCGFLTSCYSYKEGDKKEHRWIDDQNCEYYYFEDDPEATGYLEDGRKHYIIMAFKPKGTTITKGNMNLVKWFVFWGPDEDINKEWDFNNHKPI